MDLLGSTFVLPFSLHAEFLLIGISWSHSPSPKEMTQFLFPPPRVEEGTHNIRRLLARTRFWSPPNFDRLFEVPGNPSQDSATIFRVETSERTPARQLCRSPVAEEMYQSWVRGRGVFRSCISRPPNPPPPRPHCSQVMSASRL